MNLKKIKVRVPRIDSKGAPITNAFFVSPLGTVHKCKPFQLSKEMPLDDVLKKLIELTGLSVQDGTPEKLVGKKRK